MDTKIKTMICNRYKECKANCVAKKVHNYKQVCCDGKYCGNELSEFYCKPTHCIELDNEQKIERLIDKCPICHSEDIIQDIESQHVTMHTPIGSSLGSWRNGSHCNNCGVKLFLNKISEIDFYNQCARRIFNEW